MALALGANLGPRRRTLLTAVEQLSALLGTLKVAPLYRSRPISSLPQPTYLNTAVLAATDLSPEAILAVAKLLELRAGRQHAPRCAPRSLDIDLLLYGSRVSSAAELTLPHPRLRRRRFVLAPLADIAPDLPIPPDGATVAHLLAVVGQEDQVERIAWYGGTNPQ